MAKTNHPAEFVSQWQYERHLEDLERELAGRERRVAELQATPAAHPDTVKQAQAEAAAVREQLAHYGHGQSAAAKRPRAAKKETRAK